jgi:hypothetical protein
MLHSTPQTDAQAKHALNTIVSWSSQSHGIRGGLVSNVPATTKFGRVIGFADGGFLAIQDDWGQDVRVPADAATFVSPAFAGWAKKFKS